MAIEPYWPDLNTKMSLVPRRSNSFERAKLGKAVPDRHRRFFRISSILLGFDALLGRFG
jgi:hypothetical protein